MGETAAFDAVCALAQALPGALGSHALAISRALRVIELVKQGQHFFVSGKPGIFCLLCGPQLKDKCSLMEIC